ncbi:MAG: SsrA-binding protein SmpB [Spirochaetota bacterium]
MAEPEIKILGKNKKAFFNYSVEESMECGIELKGTEVKSIKSGKFSFTDSYAKIKNDEVWLVQFHISPYPFGNIFNHEPDRERKLLVHKHEIKRLKRKVEERGFTLVPLQLYLKKGLVKVELGVCRGKKIYDKRDDIKQRDLKRETDRELRNLR